MTSRDRPWEEGAPSRPPWKMLRPETRGPERKDPLSARASPLPPQYLNARYYGPYYFNLQTQQEGVRMSYSLRITSGLGLQKTIITSYLFIHILVYYLISLINVY